MTEPACIELRIQRDPDVFAMARAVTDGILAARARGARRLLVDLRALEGLAPPSLARRDELVTSWARAAAGELVVAIVAPAALLDPERFGVMIAAAAGLRAEPFEDETAARAWLARQPDPFVLAPASSADAQPRAAS